MYRCRLPSAQADGELQTGQMCLTGWAPVKTHAGFCSVQVLTQPDLPLPWVKQSLDCASQSATFLMTASCGSLELNRGGWCETSTPSDLVWLTDLQLTP